MNIPPRPHYTPKLPPLGKQKDVIDGHWFEPIWALLCRPGTGKSKMGVDHAALNYMAGNIEALIVIAPNGVHRQWAEEAIPTHLGDVVPVTTCVYDSGMGVRARREIDTKLRSKSMSLKVLTISYEGLQTKQGFDFAYALVNSYRCMVISDESHRVSNIKAAGYKYVRKIMRLARVRRIATGTLIKQNPFSAFGQFELMGDALLGFSSIASFRSMYAEMLPEDNGLVKHIAKQFAEKHKGRKIVPQIMAKGEDGRPKFRNLGDLRKRLERYSSFLTLADLGGVEPTVLQSTRFVELSPEQQTMYGDLVKWGVSETEKGLLTAESTLALSMRLQQIIGGFSPTDDDPNATPVAGDNPRLAELLAIIEELGPDVKVVVWCKFTAELRAVAMLLDECQDGEHPGPSRVAEYHGNMNEKAKRESKERFINDPACRFFVGQQRAGGTGLDGLQRVADYMVFYSNDYSALEREQAIARLARTKGSPIVNVIDLMAKGTVDEDVVRCMQTGLDVSEAILRTGIKRTFQL